MDGGPLPAAGPNVTQALSVGGILECHAVSKFADAFLEELNGSLG